nr:MAG TPA: minor tail protein [Caudoviricetes sp.]
MPKKYFIEEIRVPMQSNTPPSPQNIRAQIVDALKKHLESLNFSVEVFEIYVFDKDNLPLIIVKDTDDAVEAVSFERIKHELSVSINLIASSYSKNDELLLKVLDKLKSFEGKFNFMELNAVNRSNIEVLDKDYVMTELRLKFVYHTQLWSV